MATRVVRIFTCDGCGEETVVNEGEKPPFQEFTIQALNLETGQRNPVKEVLVFHHGCVPETLRVIDYTPGDTDE